MKTILFTLESPHGTFWIRPEPANRVRLMVDSTPLESYRSASLAARAVAAKKTGYDAWDADAESFAPDDLHKWKRGEGVRKRRKVDTLTRAAAGGRPYPDWDSSDPV